jgi:hypothetical protein
MTRTPAAHCPTTVRLAFAALGLLGCAIASAPADVVILKDGFVIQGTVRKETEMFVDPASGTSLPLTKPNGFDYIDEGPKLVIFSTHAKQLGEISKDVKIRPDYHAYKTKFTRKNNYSLPLMTGVRGKIPDFDKNWKRTFDVNAPGGFDRIEQQLTYLDPYTCYVMSPTHLWSLGFRTTEMDPRTVRKYLSTHPELAEAEGKCEPLKRVMIVQFMLDTGWLQLAKEELDRLKADHPGAMSKEEQEAVDKVTKQFQQATNELIIDQSELALNAGRYGYAGDLLATFPAKTADAKEVERATKLMAQHKTATERHAQARRLLRKLIDESVGAAGPRTAVGAGGGPAAVVWPAPKADPTLLVLAEAAEHVYGEVHPDSVSRLTFFADLADQAERERAGGKEPSKKPEELLATAVSGWARGKNGATPQPEPALRIWQAREMVLNYQRAPDGARRAGILANFRKTAGNVGLDELAQIISLLPPAEPDDLKARSGQLVPEKTGAPPGTYKRRSAGTFDHPTGIEYLVKLPPEYHHGRAYPVLFALTSPSMDPELMLLALAREAEKNGYILVAPIWTNQFDKGWQFKGEDHDYVTGVLRDVIRHYTVDNDRVFLFGAAEGANMAYDIGLSHPDLFAGVLMMSPTNPRWLGTGIQYWKNAQKLPFYIVTGQLVGKPNTDLRETFAQWMPKGFPGIHVIYKGRGIEWFPGETPVMFDWMGRKKRINGAATLQLGTDQIRQAWQTMRLSDNRFYWLGADKIAAGNLLEGHTLGGFTPAGLSGDIRGNTLILDTRGIRTVTVWLSRDMIDWTKPVYVKVNNQQPFTWKPKVLEPDVGVLLDDYVERGDRRMLFLQKLEFTSGN